VTDSTAIGAPPLTASRTLRSMASYSVSTILNAVNPLQAEGATASPCQAASAPCSTFVSRPAAS
jgi:hypothetical protein